MTTQPPSGTIWKPGLESLRDRGSSPSQVGKIRLRSKPKGQIRRETILVLLRPDCLVACHCGDVLKRFEQAGLEIIGCKMALLSDGVLAKHCVHVYNRPFYPVLKSYMQSSPVIALALAGHNAVAQVGDLMGPTDSPKAAKDTILGDYEKNATMNVVHGSESPENAAAEIDKFFTGNELFDVTTRKALSKMKHRSKTVNLLAGMPA
jgi:nucleoside-diphosphate kinase